MREERSLGFGFGRVDLKDMNSQDSSGFKQESDNELEQDQELNNSSQDEKLVKTLIVKSLEIHKA
jgi:hypothetical protein